MRLFRKTPKEDDGKTLSEQLSELGIEYKELPPLASDKIPPTVAELEKKYKEGTVALEKNPDSTDINVTELRFLAYGLDFIDFAKNGFGVELTLRESDIEIVEEMAEQAHRALVAKELPQENLTKFAKIFAGYLGLLITIHKGGEWVAESTINKDAGPGIMRNNGATVDFVLAKAYSRLQNGKEDDLVIFYRSIETTNS